MDIRKKIKDDHGLVAFYCRKRGINRNTLDAICNGNNKGTGREGRRILDILRQDGYPTSPAPGR